MYNTDYCYVELKNCEFLGNSSVDICGGLMFHMNTGGSVESCVFRDNSAHDGGGVLVHSGCNPVFVNCLFDSNSATRYGGAIHIVRLGASSRFINCTFAGNQASSGSAICIYLDAASLVIANCILWDGGNEIYDDGSPNITVTHSNVQSGWPEGDGNIDADPLFLDVPDDDLRLSSASPCIDSGDNYAVPDGISADLDGRPRIVNGIVDMGAYELPSSDGEGPVTSNVVAEPTPINVDALVTATVDDSTTGESNIQLAEYSIDGSDWYSMHASDDSYDEVAEDVFGIISAFSTAGVHEVCVRGRDTVPNNGVPECTLLAIYDPEGGFVTGGGWIWSLVDDDYEYMAVEGKANFGFVSKYKKGATVPTGQTEFVFNMADLDFHSSSYQWLVVTGSDYAKFKGAGTINGEGDYKFMIWAGDGVPDTFRIRIWTENDEGIETAVYDNGIDQAIGGGSIVIHVKD